MHSIPFLDIPALEQVSGNIRVPGSKSISNRALLLAALCEAQTTLYGVLDSDDTQVMLTALRQLGCRISFANPNNIAQGISIYGFNALSKNASEEIHLFLGNAGTVMRPLTAMLALAGGAYTLSGVPRMHERPIGDLIDALRSFGCAIECTQNEGFPPLRITPPQLNQEHLRQAVEVKGNTSSQFLTALLMALPLAAKEDIVIKVVGELISKPYIAITLKLMKDFGIDVQNNQFQEFIIPAGSQYKSPTHYEVEADASSASYFIGAGAIAATADAPLVIEGVGSDSIQGDLRFVEAAQAMGAHVEMHPKHLVVHRQSWPLKAITLNANHIPDAAMTLAVMALYAQGTTRLTDIGSWRVKETDRIDAMRNELMKLGAHVTTGEDFIEITPPALDEWQNQPIHTYDDHRVAMCFSLAAFNPLNLPVRILEPACVNKTYPTYFDDFFKVAQTNTSQIPVITIDGPSASGKGTLANELAKSLGYHYLDSGLLYRITAWAALENKLTENDVDAVAALAQALPVTFKDAGVWYKGNEISEHVRAEAVGMMASKIATLPAVRSALAHLQQSFRRLPGLVADGRDMGTVIFKDAPLKIFLTADAYARAERRHKQLMEKGIPAKITDLYADLQARDEQDMNRSIAPLKPAEDAHLLDNSNLTVEESIKQALILWEALQKF